MRIRDVLPAAALVAVCIFWLAAATVRPLPGSTQVGVVFPPHLGASEVIARISAAGGRLVREGAWPFITVVALDDPQVLQRLDAVGALLTINPLVFGGCLTRPSATTGSLRIQGT